MAQRRLIPTRTAGAVTALALVFAACGGDDDTVADTGAAAIQDIQDTQDTEDTQDTASNVDGADEGESGDAGSSATDDGEAGTGFRPDWTPVWLFLPEDLVITIAPNDPSVGEAYITGFIGGGDLQLLYDQAAMMVQSAGYIIDDQYEGPGKGFSLETEVPGQGFSASHTSDGSVADFSVYQADAQRVQWNILFRGLPRN